MPDPTTADRAELAALVELTAALRRTGAPVATSDVADALLGMLALGTLADPELCTAVLKATIGKYPGRQAPEPTAATAADRTGTGTEQASPEHAPTRSHQSPHAHGDEDQPHGATSTRRDAAAAADRMAVDAGAVPDPRSGLGDVAPESAQRHAVLTDTAGSPAGSMSRPSPPHAHRPYAPRWRPVAPAVGEAHAGDALDRATGMVIAHYDGALSHPSASRRGGIDVAATVRQALRPGHSLLPPRRRAPRRRRARALVLVDVSNSVRATSQPWLEIAAALARRSRHVRVAAITDRATEVTSALRQPVRPGELLGVVEAAGADPGVSSDWGAAFAELAHDSHRWQLRHRHLLVLGDGRSNGHSPRVDSLAELVGRCASSWWITSEPPGAWGLGNGEPDRYRSVVERMDTARTAAALLERATDLSARRSSAR